MPPSEITRSGPVTAGERRRDARTLRAVIPNPEHLLLPGMYLRAVLPLADDDQAILVPQQAVTRDAKGEPEVKLLGPGDTVVERRIATAEVVGHDWRVTSGLKPGDRVVTGGAFLLKSDVLREKMGAGCAD